MCGSSRNVNCPFWFFCLSKVDKDMIEKVGFSNWGLLGGTPTLEPKAVWKSQKRMKTNASRNCFDGFNILR